MLTLLAVLNSATALLFIGWLLLPSHVPGPGVVGFGAWRLGIARVSFCMIICVETIRLVQNFAVWLFALAMKDPVPKAPVRGLRVAMLTTIVPAKEPIYVVERTLRAMREVRYRGQVDVWILDEGDDPAVKDMAERLGVYHFSRRGIPHYNQPKGPFRAKTKAGNHNAWRDNYERYYDVVAQMDPDHVPAPCFLERTIGYFRDPDVAFVVAPQVYGNMYDSWLAHGASVQQYLFSGVVERGGNGLDAPLLIGTNHLYRPAAWQEIGGYQDSIIEDHLTSMRVQGTINPFTGNRWRGVYTPDVLAVGEGPETWTDYFNQQKRWAYGIWEILLRRKLRAGIRLRPRQRLLYGLVQFYYPSAGATVLLGTIATSVYLMLGVTAMQLNSALWGALWGASMTSWMILWLWLRRFNLAEHERREVGFPGILLALFAGPIYVAAGISALLHRPLTYAVTAKGSLRSRDSVRTFRLHLLWAAAALCLLGLSFHFHHDYTALRIWGGLAAITGLGPLLIALVSRMRGRRLAGPEPAGARRVPAREAPKGREVWEPREYDLVGAGRRESGGRRQSGRDRQDGRRREGARRPDGRPASPGYGHLAGPRPDEPIVPRRHGLAELGLTAETPPPPGSPRRDARAAAPDGQPPPWQLPHTAETPPPPGSPRRDARAAAPDGQPPAWRLPHDEGQLALPGRHPGDAGRPDRPPRRIGQGDPALRDLARDFSSGDPDLSDLVAPDLAASDLAAPDLATVGSAPAAPGRPHPSLALRDTMPDWRPGRLGHGSGHNGPGYNGNGHGHDGSGYNGSGYNGNGHNGLGYNGSGYNGNGHGHDGNGANGRGRGARPRNGDGSNGLDREDRSFGTSVFPEEPTGTS